jgi:hypothetical protein
MQLTRWAGAVLAGTVLLVVLLGTMGFARPARPRDANAKLVGQSVGVALEHHGVRFDDLSMEDDPPGKLKSVSFEKKVAGKTVRITLQLRYTVQLFSEDRKWGPNAVRPALVRKATQEPVK